MAKFRHVYCSFWDDKRVAEEMTPEDRYFYLYLLTNPRTTQVGIYPIIIKTVAVDLGYSTESTRALIKRFIEHHNLIRYDENTGEVAILKWGKYNLNKGGKPVIDCIKKELKEVKNKTFIGLIAQNIENEVIKGIYIDFMGLSTEKEELSTDLTSRGTIRGQKEKEKEKETKEEDFNSHLFYAYNFGIASPFQSQMINYMVDEVGEELTVLAMKEALMMNKTSIKYIDEIVRDWKRRNIDTAEKVEANKVSFKNRKGKFTPPTPEPFTLANVKTTTVQQEEQPNDDELDAQIEQLQRELAEINAAKEREERSKWE